MSGIKKAEVTRSLNGTMRSVEKGLADCMEMATALSSVGRKDFNHRCSESKRIHENIRRRLPDEVVRLLGGETSHWEDLIKRHDDTFDGSERYPEEADAIEKEFSKQKRESDRQLADVKTSVMEIEQKLVNKNWHCDAENAEANALRHKAESILAGLRSNVASARRAQQLRRDGFTALSEADRLAKLAEREYDRLVNLATERQKSVIDGWADILSLKSEIEAHDFKKFGAGLYSDGIRRQIANIEALIEHKDYNDAIKQIPDLKQRLTDINMAICDAQAEWESQKAKAEKALADAKEEIEKMNADDMKTYSGVSGEEVDSAFCKLKDAQDMIWTEQFVKATQAVANAIDRLREINDKTHDNRALYEKRWDLAQSIMQALYDSNYDSPSYYQEREQDALSNFCIVAAAPGGVGNVRMNVALDGKVSFEVENIPEGREKLCVDAIRSMQDKLTDNGVSFNVTDWGRAEGHKDDDGVMKVVVKTQNVVRTIQRQG